MQIWLPLFVVSMLIGTQAYAQSSNESQASSSDSSILDSYDSTPVTFRMTCWTGQTGYVSYAIQGKNIVVNSNAIVPIVEQRGNVYAGKDVIVTIIVDYDNKKVTQFIGGIGGLEEVFECI